MAKKYYWEIPENETDIETGEETGNVITHKIELLCSNLTGSISITIDQLFDEYDGTLTYTTQVFTNEIGHKITITCRGELSGIGSADNEVVKVVITDEKGKDVTKNYKIDTQMGELVVTP